MLPHSPKHLAQRWDDIAGRIDADFERRVHEFSLEATPDRDGGGGLFAPVDDDDHDAGWRMRMSDPTSAAALTHDPMRSLEYRWHRARNELAVIVVQVAGRGGLPQRNARLVANAVRRGVVPLQAKRLAHLAGRIERLVAEAAVPTDAVRRFLLGQLEASEVRPARSCDVCETPVEKTQDQRLRSGLCRVCHNAEQHLERSGRYTDRAGFTSQRRDAIARQDPDVAGRYPHSPFTPEVQ